MLLPFLEDGNKLEALSDEQLSEVYRWFMLYLLQACTCREAEKACKRILDDDQVVLERVIQARLYDLRADTECVKVLKLAVIAYLENGNKDGLRAAQVSSKRIDRLVRKDPQRYRSMQRKVVSKRPTTYKLSLLEAEILPKLEPHTKRFIYEHARFLTMAEPGLELDHLVSDLRETTLIALRWIYPFRDGLHLINTLKASVTNKGNTLITHKTRQKNQRLIQASDGSYYSMESFVEGAEGSIDERANRNVSTAMTILSKENSAAAKLSIFVQDPKAQDVFAAWASNQYGVAISDQLELVYNLRKNNIEYEDALSEYFSVPKAEITSALSTIRDCIYLS